MCASVSVCVCDCEILWLKRKTVNVAGRYTRLNMWGKKRGLTKYTIKSLKIVNLLKMLSVNIV